MHEPEPVLHPIKINELRPTQMTVGLREVARKRANWQARMKKDGGDFLLRHMIPAVRGPKERLWMIDAHHLARALHDEGVGSVLVRVIADLSDLPKPLFQRYMDNRGWLHPFDPTGTRQANKDLPRTIGELKDDPYRSLAGELRRRGGFAKDSTPYSEFLWADYLRQHIPPPLKDDDFDQALKHAVKLAKHKGASYLPGWAGISR